MKNILISLPVALYLLAATFSTTALAQDPLPSPSFTEFKMVNSNDPQLAASRIEKYSFDFTETPFLYIQIAPALTGSLRSYWTGPDDKERTRTRSITPASGNEFWLSLLHWEKDKQTGPWTVTGQLWAGTTLLSKAETNFVVTPEPLSCIFYSLGGLTLLGMRLRKTPSQL